jgi:hypothetical protein
LSALCSSPFRILTYFLLPAFAGAAAKTRRSPKILMGTDDALDAARKRCDVEVDD